MNTRKNLIIFHYVLRVVFALALCATIITLALGIEDENLIPFIFSLCAAIISYGSLVSLNVLIDFYDAIVVPKQQNAKSNNLTNIDKN